MRDSIDDFIIGQLVNEESEQAAKLASAIRESIQTYQANGGTNENAFSVDAQYEDGEFQAECTFTEETRLIVMYWRDTDNATVESLFNLENDQELCRLAGLMLSEGWVKGYNTGETQ